MSKKLLKVPEDVKISYHDNYYDGILSGYCWFKSEYCYFRESAKNLFSYKMKKEDQEEYINDCKRLNIEIDLTDPEIFEELTGYSEYEIFKFETNEETLKALASRAIWEDFVGFQNSHNGTNEHRFYTEENKTRSSVYPSKNDYRFFSSEFNPNTYYKNLPYYKESSPKINFSKSYGTFRLYDNEYNKLIAEGYNLKNID